MVIADEPTAHLDRANGRLMIALLLRATRELGMTVIASSHDSDAIESAVSSCSCQTNSPARLTLSSIDGGLHARRSIQAVMPSRARPAWVPSELYPFADHYADVGGCVVHYVDEGAGPPLLMLHGNPTWSFLYREIVLGLRDRYRCVAIDYPGFGLSTPRPGYGFTPAEHADVVEQLVLRLDLRGATLMVQDWGGPIGFAVATLHPERFAAFVIGNTWAWPKSDPPTQLFSRLLGGPIGRRLILNRNLFVEAALGRGLRRPLPAAAMNAYRGPFPTPGSRWPTAVLPREILAGRPFLAEVEERLPRVRDRRALLVWPTRDPAFGARERRRWEELFADHRTVTLEGAGHYIQEDAPEEIVAAIRAW